MQLTPLSGADRPGPNGLPAGDPFLGTFQERLFRATFDHVPVGLAHTRAFDGAWLRVNKTLCEILGYTEEELRQLSFHNLTHPDDLRRDLDQLDRLLAGDIESYKLVKRYFHKNGSTIWARVTIGLVGQADGAKDVLAVVEDITTIMEDRQALEESEARYRSLVELSPDAIVVVSNHRLVYANAAAARLFGAPTPEDLIGIESSRLIRPDRHSALAERIMEALETGAPTDISHEHLVRMDGSPVVAALEVAAVPLTHHGERAVQVVIRDVTEQRAAEAMLKHQANHDSLTGLPNRSYLRSELERAVGEGRPGALMLMDLDRFKEINDTFGHHFGDLLLSELGARLRLLFDSQTLVARLGGDEFAILFREGEEEKAREAASRLLATIGERFVLEGQTLDIGGSVGIVFYPDQGSDVNELLRRADVAMYLAKRERKGLAVYELKRDQHSPDRLKLMAELRTAIDQNQLVLHYQPKASLSTGEIRSAEALVRWHHPIRGMVPPDEFIPLAEHGGMIDRLSVWVLDSALAQVRKWRDSGRDVTVAVNLSPRNLYDQDLIPVVARLLEKWRVDADALNLELTETAIMDDPEAALETMKRLNAMGVHMAIDDFGTGYSSLGYLKRLPVKEIKIDRSFVTDMVDHKDDAFIVRSTIDLGHNLGLQVIAEGVEDQRTWDLLGVLGCDLAQGYYLSRPVPAPDLTLKLRRTNRWARN